MRDHAAARNYSPGREEFRRTHERHRAWGLVQRHNERLRRLRSEAARTAGPHTDRQARELERHRRQRQRSERLHHERQPERQQTRSHGEPQHNEEDLPNPQQAEPPASRPGPRGPEPRREEPEPNTEPEPNPELKTKPELRRGPPQLRPPPWPSTRTSGQALSALSVPSAGSPKPRPRMCGADWQSRALGLAPNPPRKQPVAISWPSPDKTESGAAANNRHLNKWQAAYIFLLEAHVAVSRNSAAIRADARRVRSDAACLGRPPACGRGPAVQPVLVVAVSGEDTTTVACCGTRSPPSGSGADPPPNLRRASTPFR